ncbi:cbb3-type cytochrome oxidase assembly protein CcoS [Thauera sp. WH-1]|uniref:cbb3-type cytochrome oxidase assembly protein CcoS n=1 Tax=Thauera sp. WH-1 TaxID=3398230 RepID=UPI0039FBEEA3
MESLYLLIPISVFLVFVIGLIFWWSLRSGQYDDMEGPAYRLLMDDRDELPSAKASDAEPTAQGCSSSAAEQARGGSKE